MQLRVVIQPVASENPLPFHQPPKIDHTWRAYHEAEGRQRRRRGEIADHHVVCGEVRQSKQRLSRAADFRSSRIAAALSR
jgi:hypothetical protein